MVIPTPTSHQPVKMCKNKSLMENNSSSELQMQEIKLHFLYWTYINYRNDKEDFQRFIKTKSFYKFYLPTDVDLTKDPVSMVVYVWWMIPVVWIHHEYLNLKGRSDQCCPTLSLYLGMRWQLQLGDSNLDYSERRQKNLEERGEL